MYNPEKNKSRQYRAVSNFVFLLRYSHFTLYLFFVHYLQTPHPQAMLTWPSFGILTALSINIDMSTKQHYLEGGRQGMLQKKT